VGAVAVIETLPKAIFKLVVVPELVDINAPPSVYQDILAVAVVAVPVLFA
jgi:hypothetical protein